MNFLKKKTNTDEERLTKVIQLIDDGIEISTGFLTDDLGNITHQVIRLKSGDLVSVSQPEKLDVVLRIATAEEQDQLVN